MARKQTHRKRAKKSNKSKRKPRKTRSKRQRGSGASCSRPTENIDIDIIDEQLTDEQLREKQNKLNKLNDDLRTAILRKDPSRVKLFLDKGADATITIVDDSSGYSSLVETIPAIMYVVRHMKGSNTIIMNYLLGSEIDDLDDEGGSAVSRRARAKAIRSDRATTLLSEAAQWGNIDMFRELLYQGARINDASHRPPALSIAVHNVDLNMIKFILNGQGGQVNMGYTHNGVRRNVINDALDKYAIEESVTRRIRLNEIIETLRRYAVEKSIMSMDDFNTKCNKSEETSKVECGIMMNELTNSTAVMTHPPTSDNTAVCFDRSALQKHLINRKNNPNVTPPILTNPVTGVEISEQDIERMFPLGLDENYTHRSFTKYIPDEKKSKKTRKIYKTKR